MKIRGPWTMLAALAVLAASTPAAEVRFALPAPVQEVVTSAEHFACFAAPVRAALTGADLDPRLRLGMQAHLALNDRDAEVALAAARALRALETDPDTKALAGLATEAQVAAWNPGTTFLREFSTRLAGLPSTPGVVDRLRALRGKIAGTTREALLAETAALGRQLDAAAHCDWPGADEIVRLHHRLANVLPLRDDMLAALDAAIAARSHP